MTAVMAKPPGWKVGDLWPGRGQSRCYRCHKPWYATARPVNVHFAPDRFQFALCQACWNRCTVDERVGAHRWVCGELQRMRELDGHADMSPSTDDMIAEIEAAIHEDAVAVVEPSGPACRGLARTGRDAFMGRCVHVAPLRDGVRHHVPGGLIGHEDDPGRWITLEAEDSDDFVCICGVTPELVANDDGPDGWVFVHYSLDGRDEAVARDLADTWAPEEETR